MSDNPIQGIICFPSFDSRYENVEANFFEVVLNTKYPSFVTLPIISTYPQFEIFPIYHTKHNTRDYIFFKYMHPFNISYPPDLITFPVPIIAAIVHIFYDLSYYFDVLQQQYLRLIIYYAKKMKMRLIIVSSNTHQSLEYFNQIPEFKMLDISFFNYYNLMDIEEQLVNTIESPSSIVNKLNVRPGYQMRHNIFPDAYISKDCLGVGMYVCENFIIKIAKKLIEKQKRFAIWFEFGEDIILKESEVTNIVNKTRQPDYAILYNNFYISVPRIQISDISSKIKYNKSYYMYIEYNDYAYDTLCAFNGLPLIEFQKNIKSKKRITLEFDPSSSTIYDIVYQMQNILTDYAGVAYD